MRLLTDKIAQLKSIRNSLDNIAIEVLEESAPQIEDKNIEQLQRGQRSDESFLPNYSPRSVAQFGKPFGPIKLYDKGDFYQGIKLEVFGHKVGITDTDSKAPMLVDRYEPEILGLTVKNWQLVKDEVLLPGYLYKLRKRLAA